VSPNKASSLAFVKLISLPVKICASNSFCILDSKSNKDSPCLLISFNVVPNLVALITALARASVLPLKLITIAALVLAMPSSICLFVNLIIFAKPQ
jgi:hypothetical protein